MEADISMLEEIIKKGDEAQNSLFVRFYGWKPRCISLGRNQKEFNLPKGIEIDVVRRPTGGRALLHDNEITYAVAGKIPKNQSVIETYKMISGGIIEGFKKLEIQLELAGERGGNLKYCMNISSGADICFEGKKFIGSAQYRKNGCFLQHGSILRNLDFDFASKIFNEKIEKDKIAVMDDIKCNLKNEDIINAIMEGFEGI